LLPVPKKSALPKRGKKWVLLCWRDQFPTHRKPLNPPYLQTKLTRPLPTKDGGTLRTIREACGYMTSMGEKRDLRQHWQRVCKLILARADVLAVSRSLELALFMDAKLDVRTVPVDGLRDRRSMQYKERPARRRDQRRK
jgi:hypothetical protein